MLQLEPGCDAEGLAYDGSRRQLLVACRGGFGRRRSIHVLSVHQDQVVPEAGFGLDLTSIASFIGRPARSVDPRAFQPSAIAVHPVSGDVYVLAAVARTVTVIDRTGAIRQVWSLPDGWFEKPEGLAITTDQQLWMCGEGVTRGALVARFELAGLSPER